MTFLDVTDTNKKQYNAVVSHPLQSYEWGEFRKKTGITVIRRVLEKDGKIIDGFTVTIHKIPKTKWSIGYLPKGNNPTKELLKELKKIGTEHRCIFIQLEPNIVNGQGPMVKDQSLLPSHHPLFTKHTFYIDLMRTEDELLTSFHSKTRYNIRLAEKKGVTVAEDDSEKAFREYLKLSEETTKRQRFYAHTRSYHKDMWETLHQPNAGRQSLSAHLLTAIFEKEILTAWIVFVFHDTLYYPYGASTTRHKNLMASNLVMWEAIRFGKKLGLKNFDLWGSLGPDADPRDPWYGFHKFKLGYNPTPIEFVGSYDLVINPTLYNIYKIADKARWGLLKAKALLKR